MSRRAVNAEPMTSACGRRLFWSTACGKHARSTQQASLAACGAAIFSQRCDAARAGLTSPQSAAARAKRRRSLVCTAQGAQAARLRPAPAPHGSCVREGVAASTSDTRPVWLLGVKCAMPHSVPPPRQRRMQCTQPPISGSPRAAASLNPRRKPLQRAGCAALPRASRRRLLRRRHSIVTPLLRSRLRRLRPVCHVTRFRRWTPA